MARTSIKGKMELSTNSTRCVTTRHARCVARVVTSYRIVFVPAWRTTKKHSARVYKLFFCALDSHQSQEHLLEKSEMDMSTQVQAVATPLNTCRACCACRACRIATCVIRSAARQARHSTCQNAWACVVSCRDVTRQVEFGFNVAGGFRLWACFLTSL